MARPRKIKTAYPIPYVYVSHGRVFYRPWFSTEKRGHLTLDKAGFLKPPVLLGDEESEPDDIYRAYIAARESLKLQRAHARNTIGWIVDQYLQSRQFRELAPESQRRNMQLAKILDQPLKINGIQSTLAALHIKNMSQPLMHQIADKRLDQYQQKGKKGVVQVNREVTFVGTALSWACNYIPDLGVTTNPLRGYKRYKEQANDHYVSDTDYAIAYAAAMGIRPWLQPLMELTYLTATRGVEALDIKLSDCVEAGIIINRRKGSRNNIIGWTDRLKLAVEHAKRLHTPDKHTLSDPYLLCKRNGEKLARSTAHDAMQMLKKSLAITHPDFQFFNLHRLKAKGVSDSSNKMIAGHVTESMRNRYDLTLPVVDAAR